MPELETPAAPAAAAVEPSPSIPAGASGGSASDEQILGIPESPVSPETAAAPDGQQPQEQTPPQEQEPAWQKEAEEEGLFLTAAPPELKALFSDPKVGKLVQSAWDSRQVAQAYREFIPTLKEARTIRETFPGGVEEMQRIVVDARDSQLTDMAFYSKNPELQGQLASRLYSEDRDAFIGQLKASTKFLAENDPETFLSIATEAAPKFLEQEHFPEFLDAAAEVVQAKNGERALALLAELGGWGAQKGLRGEVRHRLHPEQQRFNRERDQFNREKQEARQGQWQQVRLAADSGIVTQIQAHIAQKIESVLPAQLKSNAEVKKSLGDRILTSIDEKLKSDVSLVQPYEAIKARVLQSGRATETDQREIVSLIVNRATQLFPLVARAVIGQWTRDTVAASRSTTQRRETAAARRDIASGGSPAHRAPTITAKDIRTGGKYAGLSDREILDL